MLNLRTLKSSLPKPFKLSSEILNKVAILLIDVYRLTLSGVMPGCRFTPTCSAYAREAFIKFGFLKGFLMTLHRLGRCHPWGGEGYDPVVGQACHDTSLTRRNS